VPCLGLKSGTLGGTARHESLFVPRRDVPSRAVPRRAWAGSCRAAHLAIYNEELALVLDPSVVLVPPGQQAAAATVESESRRGRPHHLQLGCSKHPG